MKNIFIDSNIWLRLFLADQKDHYQQVVALIESCQSGLLRPYTSSIVFLEVHYVLRSFYKLDQAKTRTYLEQMRSTRDITVIETTDIDISLSYYRKYSVKFSDCLIASQLRKDIVLATFDNELKKIKEVNVKTPKEVLANLQEFN